MNWVKYISSLHHLLANVQSSADGELLEIDRAFQQWTTMTEAVRDNRQTIFLVGNGASASMASHFAADLAKNGQIHTETFTDLSLITAISNDMSFSEVFAEPLKRRAKKGDMLVTISSSGKSPNILRAIEVAREYELDVVTLSGMSEENSSRQQGRLNFYIKDDDYGNIETCHAALLHYWMDSVCL